MIGPQISKEVFDQPKRGIKVPPKAKPGDYDLPTQNQQRNNSGNFNLNSNTFDIGMNNFSTTQSKPSKDPFDFSSSN